MYLAEVQKQKSGLLGGGGKSELKLLACQRNDQNWSPVPDEMIVADEANKLNDGALVLVELSPNRQVQRIQDAGRPLVNILQNFSRQVEKFKLKEDEIDQWKQSLMIQVQELNRREMEMESRWEQVQQLENDFNRLDTQQQTIDASRMEIERLRADVERNRQELEGAWEHLRGEQRRLEQQETNSQNSQAIDREKGQVLSDLLNRLSSQINPIETVRESLNCAVELVEKQQDALNPYWQQLDIQRHAANQHQQEIEELTKTLGDRQNALKIAQSSLEQQITQVQLKVATVDSKRELAVILKHHLGTEENLYQKLSFLATNTDAEIPKQDVDVEALQQMPLAELERMVQDWQEKLDRDSGFVQEQEQELKYKQELIEELQEKIANSFGEERTDLESELADERDLYEMLNESLVGQRRNLNGQQKTLQQNQFILWQRQGVTVDLHSESSDLASIVLEIEGQKQQKSQELQNLEGDIERILTAINADQETIDHQTQAVETDRQAVQSLEEQLLNLRIVTVECGSKVNLYQEALQPIQDALDGVRDQLQRIAESLTQAQTTGDHQLQIMDEMRQAVQDLMNLPEVLI
nr:pilus motility taxis protein HmpF [Anabaena sp. UHCC 0204]